MDRPRSFIGTVDIKLVALSHFTRLIKCEGQLVGIEIPDHRLGAVREPVKLIEIVDPYSDPVLKRYPSVTDLEIPYRVR
jgi:hypothetical protein